MLSRPRVRYSKARYIIAKYCIYIIIYLLWKVEYLPASPSFRLSLRQFLKIRLDQLKNWGPLTVVKLTTEILITQQIQIFMPIQKQRLVCLLKSMEWQKIEPMGFAVFEKMWVIVIWDTHYMDTKKQCPESVLWTILKHYWNEFQ